ncbi:hypothetical protein, partial [Methylomonas methanica]|uniref:hypothetical protein n=1 Tax=Methylomonas methanica TaxID=421 RepID=UPI001A9D84EE
MTINHAQRHRQPFEQALEQGLVFFQLGFVGFLPGNIGESLFLPKDFFERPSRKKSAKITRPLMPSAP